LKEHLIENVQIDIILYSISLQFLMVKVFKRLNHFYLSILISINKIEAILFQLSEIQLYKNILKRFNPVQLNRSIQKKYYLQRLING